MATPMNTATPANSKYTKWKSHQETLLVVIMMEQKHLGHWGNNNSKKPAYKVCKVALAGTEGKDGAPPQNLPCNKE